MAGKLMKRSSVTGPVRYEVRGPIDNPTALRVAVNYEEAPVPQHYYVADWCNVVAKDLDVIFSFGNLERDGRLRSKIEIVFPAFQFIRQIWKSSREFHSRLGVFLDKLGLKAIAVQPAELVTDKLQVLMSNNALFLQTGTECLMDFFYISPKDLWSKPRRGEQLDLEAVVRVLISPTLLMGFLDACEPVAAALHERFDEAMRMEESENENMESEYAK